jgi:hypothetical protein
MPCPRIGRRVSNAVVDDTHYSAGGVFSCVEMMNEGTIRVGEDFSGVVPTTRSTAEGTVSYMLRHGTSPIAGAG